MNDKKIYIIGFLFTLILGLSGCEQEGPMEQAGERMDNMANNVQDEMEDAGNQVEDACEEVKGRLGANNTNC